MDKNDKDVNRVIIQEEIQQILRHHSLILGGDGEAEWIGRKVMDTIAERIDIGFYPKVSKDIKELTKLYHEQLKARLKSR